MGAILSLLITIEPGLVSIAKDIYALFKKYPTMTPDQFTAFVTSLHDSIKAGDAETLALMNTPVTPIQSNTTVTTNEVPTGGVVR